MNNLYYDYIGAKGNYEIIDYIDNTSNILDTKINNLDIKYNNLINTSNTIDYVDGSLINVNNTYIYNNNQYGEIRFKTQINDNHYVKVGRDGKLYLWITYNIIRPEILEGWYEVSDILADYFFNLAIINFTLTGYGGDLAYLQQQITTINIQILSITDAIYIHTVQINKLIELQEASLVDELLNSTVLDPLTIYQQITARGINSISRISTSTASLIGLGGLGLLGWIASGTYGYYSQLLEEKREKLLRLNNIYGELLTNSGTTNLNIPDVNNPGKTLKESLYQYIYNTLSTLNNDVILYETNKINSLGFINTNITTAQTIQKINTNEITLNGENLITKLGNYLLKEGGTMTGRINMNTGLYGIPTPVYSTGDRITLNPSSSPSTYPYSIGIDTNNFWCCVPNGASYNWYVDNVSKLSLSSTSLTVNNNINITSSGTNKLIFDNVFNNNKIQLNSTNGIGVDTSGIIICSSGAVRFANSTGSIINATITPAGDFTFLGTVYSGAVSTSGSIVASSLALGTTGDITTVRNITASGLVKANSFTENNISLASKYLKLDGNNAMALNANIALSGTGGFIGDGSGLTGLNYNNIAYNALSFQTPLSKNALNQVSIDLSTYSPTSVNDTRYLRLNGANDMANTLNIRILNQYAIDIQTTDSTAPNCIAFKNNTTSYGFIGLPGTTYSGNYANNLFLQSTNAIIFNSGSITSTGTPRMIIMTGGNIGIGTTNALQKFHIQGGATTAMIRIETNTDAENQTTGIEFGIPSFTSIKSAKITSTSLTGNKSDLKFYTRNGTAVDAFNFMTLSSGGDLVIGGVNGVNLATTENRITTGGSTLCGVFGGDTLLSSYWGVAVNLNFGGFGDGGGSAGNTKIPGTSSFTINTRTSGLSSGFDKTLFTVRNSGNVGIGTTDPQNKLQVENGNFRVYNGAGQIRGVSSYANIATSMATGSLTIGDTSKNFGGSSGWNANTAGLLMECDNNTEIAVHDNATRIASFMYYAGGGTNQFYIGRDMGWGAISQVNFYGNIQIANSLTNKLIFDDFTNTTKIQLFTGYSFGINASTLRYDSAGVHKFNTNNNQTFIIDADGNTRATGNMVASGNSTANRYYCSASTLLFTSILAQGNTYYGWFLGLNGYWYTGYSYLTISASVNMAGSGNIFCWNGRVYLSASGGLLTNGGVLQITTDYRNPVSGDNAINVEERWDNWGNNFLRFYGTNLNAGVLTIKVYG